MLAVADERLDDLQRGTRFTFGPPALEIGRQLAVGPQHFLVANVVFGGAAVRGGAFSESAHVVRAGRTGRGS